MKTLRILSKHASLTAAVEAAKIDLSYNEPLARRDLRSFDKAGHGMKPVTEAYVVELDTPPQSYSTLNPETGKVVEVWYRLDCDIKLLNKYSPFHHCLHDGPFYQVVIEETEIRVITEHPLRNGSDARKSISEIGLIVTKL